MPRHRGAYSYDVTRQSFPWDGTTPSIGTNSQQRTGGATTPTFAEGGRCASRWTSARPAWRTKNDRVQMRCALADCVNDNGVSAEVEARTFKANVECRERTDGMERNGSAQRAAPTSNSVQPPQTSNLSSFLALFFALRSLVSRLRRSFLTRLSGPSGRATTMKKIREFHQRFDHNYFPFYQSLTDKKVSHY